MLRDCRSNLAIAACSWVSLFERAKAVTFGLLVAVFRPVLSGERCHRLHVCCYKKKKRRKESRITSRNIPFRVVHK